VVISSLSNILEIQRHRLMLWVPVMFGAGIAIYFALSTEPTRIQISAILALSVVSAAFIRPKYVLRTALLMSVSLIFLGLSYSSYRTNSIKAPILKRHYYGPVYGRIIGLDRSASNALRVLLDQIYLPGFSVDETPEHVRISLQGYIPENTLLAGKRVAVTASLSPPSPPAEPNGFDFRRMAWFMSLGGVGYTRNPVIPAITGDKDSLQIQLYSARLWLSGRIKAAIDGQNGAFAAAILTGDRSDIDPQILESLRASNLAHLLAISGLHMGLLSGFVFAFLRYGFALVPYLSLRIRPKKVAAGLAIGAGAAYLLLSGASVATQRAFIMTSVVLFAVILDKPAFTLRAVAFAALIVLLIKPYSVLEAGFQMSFAATTALISAYEFLNKREIWARLSRGKWKYVKPILALLFTSGVAGLATAPISAFHFNQISQYGLAANMLAVPIMGMIVMPSAVVALILMPFGLEKLAFAVMGKGIGGILSISEIFSEMEGALRHIQSAPDFILAGITIGGLIFFLWSGRGRVIGFIVILITIFAWSTSDRPMVLIDEDSKMFGLLTEDGRVVNKPRGSGYSVKIWLENDGDAAAQVDAFAREGIDSQKRSGDAQLTDGWSIFLYSGDDPAIVESNCDEKTILVLSKLNHASDTCEVIDANYLRKSGAVSVNIVFGTPVFEHSRAAARNRPWGY
jgi:competence protein ComEC